MKKVTLIAGNGGGFTLQVVDGDYRYQHYYSEVTSQTAEDVLAAMDGDDASDWDGNEVSNGWLEPTQREIEAGGYDTIEADCKHTVLEWGVDHSWYNVEKLTDLFADLVHG